MTIEDCDRATAAELRRRWDVLRSRFPLFTPDTFRGFVEDVATRRVYARDWRTDARWLLDAAPELLTS